MSESTSDLRAAVALRFAEQVANKIHGGNLTLVHSSDGWIAMFKWDRVKAHEIKPAPSIEDALTDLFGRRE